MQVGSVWPTGSTLTITGQATTGQAITGATVGASFGVPTVTVTLNQNVSVLGVPSAAAFGAPAFIFAKQNVQVFGLDTAQQFGSLQTNQTVSVPGFVPYTAYIPSITGQVICGDGHVVGGIGGPQSLFGQISFYTHVNVAVGGVPSAAQFGQPQIAQIVHPLSVPTAAQFGQQLGWKITVWGIPSAAAFGTDFIRVFDVWMREATCTDLDLAEASCTDLALATPPVIDIDLVPAACT